MIIETITHDGFNGEHTQASQQVGFEWRIVDDEHETMKIGGKEMTFNSLSEARVAYKEYLELLSIDRQLILKAVELVEVIFIPDGSGGWTEDDYNSLETNF